MIDGNNINKKYWSNIEPEKIMAGTSYPGLEILGRLEHGAHILDVGCGLGVISEYLDKKGYAVTGIDINSRAIAEDQARSKDITYLVADATERLPFPTNSFDGIVVPYLFVSIIDRERQLIAAQEITRVLKNGGYLWICEATQSSDYIDRYKIGKEKTGEDNIALSLTETGEIKRVIRHYTEAELDSLFSGLSKIESTRVVIKSPHSGMNVESLRIVYQKP